MKQCLVYPHLQIEMKMRRVYVAERLPFPGPNCDCESCSEKWMTSLAERFKLAP